MVTILRSMARTALIPLFLFIFLAPAAAYQQFEFLREFGDTTQKASKRDLDEPRAVALCGDTIYVADTGNHRVVVYDPAGKIVRTWGGKGDEDGKFRSPAGIAVDEQGMVYVADTGNGRIQVFDGSGKFLRSFGTKGSAQKQFSSPSGIAAVRGLLYVADAGNSRIQVLSSDGVFMGTMTVAGTKQDDMQEPVDVAVDRMNRVYVLDRDAGRVRIFDSSGKQVASFGGSGKGIDDFRGPRGLAVDDRGNIYVADTGGDNIKKFDNHGKILGALGCEGNGPGQFKKPSALKVDREGRLFILDSEKNTLQVFQGELNGVAQDQASPLPSVGFVKELPGEVTALAAGDQLRGLAGDSVVTVGAAGGKQIGSRGSDPGMLKNPRGLAADASGNIWVADTSNDRLQKFNGDGTLLQVIGRPGSADGEFDSPAAVAVSPKGNIIVADKGNRRVQVFSAKGVFLGAFGKPGKESGQFNAPVGVAVDGSENIYVVDRDNDRIARFDNSGNLVWEAGREGKGPGEFTDPDSIAVTPDGEIYVLDAGNDRVQVFDTKGTFLRLFGSEGKGHGEFREPAGMTLEGGIRLYVGDRGNGRVQAFALRQVPSVPSASTAQSRMNEIQVNWKPSRETYLEKYKVYRAERMDGEYTFIAATTEHFYIDRGLPSNHAYFYRVSGIAKEGKESALSAAATAVTPKLVPGIPKQVRIEAQEKQITLSWLPNTEPFLSSYRIYRSKQPLQGFEAVGQADRSLFIDSQLADETLYYYRITTVGKEADESAPSEIVFAQTPKAALMAPPLELARIEVGEIFASSYKYYESHPLGKVVIRNNTDNAYSKVKLSFSVREMMDYPWEMEIESIPAKQEMEIPITPVFSNRILEVTENTPLQSEFAVTYYVGGEAKKVTRSFPVTLYERHAMVWDDKSKLGAFVTSKDPPLADFTRSVVQQYVDAYPNLNQPIVYARSIYDALGVLGLAYIVDPSSPFQQFSENTSAVDYLQYPRDTLARKSGDCDDLSILFAAALENIGIGTAFVDVPGHVFILFDTGAPEKNRATLGFPDELLVSYQGSMWVPVEMTIVGTPFTRAWQKGAEEYRDWSAKKKAEIISTQKAWDRFKPVTLANGDAKIGRVKREEIEDRYKGELEALSMQRLDHLSVEYRDALKKDPKNVEALTQLGILYGENGSYAEALEQFQKVLAVDKQNAVALNNVGNINYYQERLDDARTAYEASLASAPGDAGAMSNLARVLLRQGKKEEAKKLFQDAAAIDPRVVRIYGDLAASLHVVK
jgi:DNA-binding beta-propeller fold protein YncE